MKKVKISGRPTDHQWKKVGWTVQYWVVHGRNVLCTFNIIRFCSCHISFDSKGLGSPKGPPRWIFGSPSPFISGLGQPSDLLLYTLQGSPWIFPAGFSVYWSQGPISWTGHELKIQNWLNFRLLLYHKFCLYQVASLFSCCDMCKFMTWLKGGRNMVRQQNTL